MRVGVREYVEFPFERQPLIDSIKHTADLLQRRPVTYHGTTHIFSFLPSKAGVGASTLALNVERGIGPPRDFRVLLSDFDLNSGMMRFLFKLKNEFSVLDAVERSSAMDENLWPQLVTSIHRMDVLHAGRVNPSIRIEGAQVRNLIHFMRSNYDALCSTSRATWKDTRLTSCMNPDVFCWCARPKFLLCTWRAEKLQFLKTVDLATRVGVVLNRVPKKPVLGEARSRRSWACP